ncbi:hypothetical protein VTK73DRAFT_8640 [Phialemonium thermophilum]|uniref:Uncharacterized protein n=1 Tax=Phialemonium thermophilum TaxID=223376 RepID=A0ABR3W780_9PEZI
MAGFTLTQFFFPSSSRPRRSRSRRTRPAINISRNSGANIFPCVWLGADPSPFSHICACQHPCAGQALSASAGSISRTDRDDHAALCMNQAGSSPAGCPPPQPTPSSAAAMPMRRRHSQGHGSRGRRPSARPAPPRASDPSGVAASRFLQFCRHWRELRRARTCFVPRPRDADGRDEPEDAQPLEAEVEGRALRFCVVDQTFQRWPAGPCRFIITCPVKAVYDVLLGLAPPCSNRSITISYHTPMGEELGDLDVLERAIPHGWPFKIILQTEEVPYAYAA